MVVHIVMIESDDDADDDSADASSNNNAIEQRLMLEQQFELVASILRQKYKNYPGRVQTKVNRLVQFFLLELEHEIHKLLCNNRVDEDGNYLGFDIARDSIEEVEAAILTF